MTLPASINSLASWPAWHTTDNEPLVVSGNLYLILTDATNAVIRAWKSTDGGDSWSEPATTRPAVWSGSDGRSAASTLVGTKIHVAYPASGTAAIAYSVYDTATDTWNTAVTNGPQANGNAQVASTVAITIDVKANGDVVICYTSLNTITSVNYARTMVVCYTASLGGSAAWGTPYDVQAGTTALGTATTNYDLRAARMIGDSLTVAFTARSSTAGTLTLRALTFSGTTATFGTAVNVVTTADTTVAYFTGQMTAYTLAGTNYVVLCRTNKTSAGSTSSLLFHRYSIATRTLTAATGNGNTISDSTTNGPDYATSEGLALYDPVNNVHRAFWVIITAQDIYRDTDNGSGTFSTDVQWNTAIVLGLDIGLVNGNAVGIVYNDNGTVKYDQYVVRVTKPFMILSQAVQRAAAW